MKKSKLFIVALIAVLMTVGLVMASCRVGCVGAGTCEIKSGKGDYCSNIDYNYNTDKITGCAATQAAVLGGSGKCDC